MWKKIEQANEFVHRALVILFTIYLVFHGPIEIKEYYEKLGSGISYDYVLKYLQFFLYAAILLLALVNTISFLSLKWMRQRIESIESENRHITSERDAYHRLAEKYRGCEEHSRIQSRKNARCDKEIFNCLFFDLYSGVHNERVAVSNSLDIVRRNIIDVLDTCSSIFSLITGEFCPVCIQAFSPNGPEKENGIVKTIERDSKSSISRHGPPVGQPVRGNTSHVEIFVNGKDIFIQEDMQGAIRAGKFSTTSKRWTDQYNAIMIAAIPPINPFGPEEVTLATLCVDNKGGGFSDEVCQHFVRDAVWRLSVMLYRLDALNRAKQEIESFSTREP